MSSRTHGLSPELESYLRSAGVRETPVLEELREETRTLAQGGMQISPEQGQLMHVMARMLGARRTLEVGVFTGYSALWVASALPSDGLLVACDVSEEWTNVAKTYWAKAGLAERIELRLGPALATLDGLLEAGQADSFDLAFIDADKEAYGDYYERCLRLVRPGGVLLFDNALWGGSVAKREDQRPSTIAVRALNERVSADERVHSCLVPIGDGLLIAHKAHPRGGKSK